MIHHLAEKWARSLAQTMPRAGGLPSTEEIRTLAYRLWEHAGEPEGNADYFWSLAELALRGIQ